MHHQLSFRRLNYTINPRLKKSAKIIFSVWHCVHVIVMFFQIPYCRVLRTFTFSPIYFLCCNKYLADRF